MNNFNLYYVFILISLIHNTFGASCGIQNSKTAQRTGDLVKPGDAPWFVAIFKLLPKPQLICGGTLIHEFMILSAAHCFYDESMGSPLNNINDYEIWVNKTTRTYDKNSESSQKLKIKKLMFYEEKMYNPHFHYGSDIILIILEKPVTFSSHVLPACLNTSDKLNFNPGENVTGLTFSWGYNEESHNLNEFLSIFNLPYFSYNDCLKTGTFGMTFDKFCAGFVKPGSGLALGDNGNGLVFKDTKYKQYYLRGIVSTKSRGTKNSIVTVTDISYFMDWIVKNMNEVDQEKTKKQ